MASAALFEALSGAQVIDLGRPLFQGMPQSANHTPFRIALQRRHGDAMRPDGGSAANDLLVTGTHVGTHIDALCHVSHDGLIHGGVSAAAAQTGGRFSSHGIETVAPFVCRAALLDIPEVLSIEACAGGYEVTVEDLERAAVGIDLSVAEVILVRTGWGKLFERGEEFVGRESGTPGPSEAGARWLAEHRPRAVGSDTIAFEQTEPGAGHSILPAHRVLLVEHGIHIIETLNLEELATSGHREFLFILSPLPLVGATGSPVRPLAVIA